MAVHLAAFGLALAVHGALLWLVRTGAFEPPVFSMNAADPGSLEVDLVAAPAEAEENPASAIPESAPQPEPVPASTPESIPTPEPEPIPEQVPEPPPIPAPRPEPQASQPTPPPVAKTPARPAATPKRVATQPGGPRGDGSSAVPGTDSTTRRAGGGGGEVKPGYLRNPHPAYPESARRAGHEGVVRLFAEIDEKGRPVEVRVLQSSGFAVLDQRALETVRDRWRFKPARMAGVPVRSSVVIPIRFSLR